jgi:hypothetical protein
MSPLIALLNDSAVVGVGGTVQAMEAHSPVRMEREHVEVDFGNRRVVAEFSFQNQGAATNVLMGFPEEGYGDIQVPGGATGSYLESFRSWVDGEPIATELWRNEWDPDSQVYRQWWTKTVWFAEGQRRWVRSEYVTQYSSDTMTQRRLYYVLGTGGPWAGTIGHAKIVVDISGVPRGGWVGSDPQHHRRSGDKLVWEFRDFEPPSLTFSVSVGSFGKEVYWKPKPGTTVPGVGYVFRR